MLHPHEVLEKLKKAGLSLNAPISGTVVADFERLHRITLPEDYRSFITTIGSQISQDGRPSRIRLSGKDHRGIIRNKR